MSAGRARALTQPFLPLQRNGRERYQSQGPAILPTPTNMHGLGMTDFGMGMDMDTSDEEAS